MCGRTGSSSSCFWGKVPSDGLTKSCLAVRRLSSNLPSSSDPVLQSKFSKEEFADGEGERESTIVLSEDTATEATAATNNTKKSITIRLSKLLSQNATNLTISRRQAERLIHDGEVTLAGRVIRTPQAQLDVEEVTSNTVLKVQGKAVQFDPSLARSLLSDDDNDNDYDQSSSSESSAPPRIWAVHKVAGEVVSERDPHNRPSMMDRLRRGGVGKIKASRRTGGQKQQVHLKPIGRLDMMTEGLMLVTNDGDFARQMELPSSHIHRVYRVRVHGRLTSYKLDRIRKGGIRHENVRYSPMMVSVEKGRRSSSTNNNHGSDGARRSSTNTWLQITSTEGKNRQIRNVFAALGGKDGCSERISRPQSASFDRFPLA
jgi:23S rRNA pseudouridine2605 synthase